MNFSIIVLLLTLVFTSFAAAQTTAPVSRFSTWNSATLAASRERVLSGDARLLPAAAKLRKEADDWLTKPLDVVTDKPADHLAPSGDPHDYTSVSGYFWPDPADPKAPWVMHDGKVNKDAIEKFDGPRMGRIQKRITTGALAYYFTADDRYARDAASQLRAWFLAPETRMNPHMDYAQCVPNKSKGNPWGIIDFNGLPDLLNATLLLADSPHWTPANDEALQKWMREFNVWMTTSDLGIREGNATNNHGTFYDLMVLAAARYTGDDALARKILAAVVDRRYSKQIEPDGSTPHEQKRVFAAMYTCWNLKGLADLAVAGRQLSPPIELYDEPSRALANAATWLAPFVNDPTTWAFGDKLFKPTSPTEFLWLLRTLDPDNKTYRDLLKVSDNHRWNLIYPLPVN